MFHVFTPSAVVALCLAFFVASPVLAGSFATDFDSGLPAGATLLGTAAVDATGGNPNGKLRLTDNTQTEQKGSLVIDDLDPGLAIAGFAVDFDLLIGGGTGADGVSFAFGTAPIAPEGFAELGYETPHSLNISFDTYDPADGPGISAILYNSIIGLNKSINPRTDPAVYVPVHIDFNAGVLNLTFNGIDVFPGGIQTNFIPLAGDQFGFGGRVGGLNDNQFIDNISIITYGVPEPSACVLALVGVGAMVTFGRRRIGRQG